METFLYKIEDFQNFYDAVCDMVCKRHGITRTAFQIIFFLSRCPERNTAKEICQVRCIKSSIASMTIDKLVKNQYIVRENDSNDRRIQRLKLTSKTDSIVRDGDRAVKKVMETAFENLTKEEHDIFFQILDKIHDSIRDMTLEFETE